MCSYSTQAWDLPPWATPTGSSNEGSAACDLLKKLTKDHPFNGAVSGAVQKCFNYSERSWHKCKLAAAAITLYDTTKDFITTYQDLTQAQEIQIEIDWNTTRHDVTDKVIQTLCPASAYILNLLKVIDYGKYCNVCHESLCGTEQWLPINNTLITSHSWTLAYFITQQILCNASVRSAPNTVNLSQREVLCHYCQLINYCMQIIILYCTS